MGGLHFAEGVLFQLSASKVVEVEEEQEENKEEKNKKDDQAGERRGGERRWGRGGR